MLLYWRIELDAVAGPTVHTYVLDPATAAYAVAEVFVGMAQALVPFPITADLATLMCAGGVG